MATVSLAGAQRVVVKAAIPVNELRSLLERCARLLQARMASTWEQAANYAGPLPPNTTAYNVRKALKGFDLRRGHKTGALQSALYNLTLYTVTASEGGGEIRFNDRALLSSVPHARYYKQQKAEIVGVNSSWLSECKAAVSRAEADGDSESEGVGLAAQTVEIEDRPGIGVIERRRITALRVNARARAAGVVPAAQTRRAPPAPPPTQIRPERAAPLPVVGAAHFTESERRIRAASMTIEDGQSLVKRNWTEDNWKTVKAVQQHDSLDDALRNLTRDGEQMMYDITGSEAQGKAALSKFKRGRRLSSSEAAEIEKLKAALKDFSSDTLAGLEKAPRFEGGKVYRGLAISEDALDAVKSSPGFMFKSDASSSKKVSVARRFATDEAVKSGKKPVILEIEVQPGKHADISTEEWSYYANEAEVAVKASKRPMRIVEVVEEDDITILRLEED